jgi:hypothetical protein
MTTAGKLADKLLADASATEEVKQIATAIKEG